MHESLATIENVERLEVGVELPFVGLLIQDDRVGKDIIETYFLQVFASLPGLQGLEIGVAVDQSIHVDDRTVVDEIAHVAAAGQPDQGGEGYRVIGYQIYDALINGDLTQGDRLPDLVPGWLKCG